MIASAVRRAGWLPGLRDSDVIEWQRLRFPRLDVEIPRLTAAQVRETAGRYLASDDYVYAAVRGR